MRADATTIPDAYIEGCLDGLTAFAWWDNGIERVGTCGTSLAEAKEQARALDLWNQYDWKTRVREEKRKAAGDV